MNRRQFLTSAAAGAMALSGRKLAFAVPAAATQPSSAAGQVRVGVITDLHHMMFKKDQTHRLKAFIDSANLQKPDFILQCGDFCYPEGCPAMLEEWNRFEGPGYHVLGNHDMDKCDKQTIMKLWQMKDRYYSFDQGAFHFVVLDRNVFRTADKQLHDYASANWYKTAGGDLNCIDDQQLSWLKDDLEKADKPTIVWMHQPLIATDGPSDIGNAQQIIDVFDEINFKTRQRTGGTRVAAVFFGHDHNDLYAQRNGVHYVLLNSASYAYTSAGASFYQDPLFCFITFDPAGKITIEGRNSSYAATGVPDKVRMRIAPKISSRSLDATV